MDAMTDEYDDEEKPLDPGRKAELMARYDMSSTDPEAYSGDDWEDYDDLCRLREEINCQYYDEFERWLTAKGLKEKTVHNHLNNVAFYLDVFLVRESPMPMEAGWWDRYVDEFFGYFFIHKCMWSTPATIKSTAASLKKFYRCMAEEGHISQADYKALCDTIKEGMEDWQDECARFNDPGYDYFGDLF